LPAASGEASKNLWAPEVHFYWWQVVRLLCCRRR
jgi:hypothetical protein